jgi:hypothetical protein
MKFEIPNSKFEMKFDFLKIFCGDDQEKFHAEKLFKID